jgi:NADH-quinone oxidoreductase subunit N
MRQLDSEDISGLAGLNQRSPLLAATMTLAMVSLAGIPPLAGFFGKFLLLKAVIEQGATNHGYYYLAFTALVGVVISLYFYFGVIREIYWSIGGPDRPPIGMSRPIQFAMAACIAGMLWLGLFPGGLLNLATIAAGVLRYGPLP